MRRLIASLLVACYLTSSIEATETTDKGAIATATDRVRQIEADSGPASPELAEALARLGLLLHQSGAPADAVSCFERALRIREKLPGQPNLAATLANLGGLCWQIGDYSRARPHLEAAVALARQGANENQLAATLNAHGLLLHAIGDLEAARATLSQALELFERQTATAPMAKTLSNLGLLLEEAGDSRGARSAFERALALTENADSLRVHRATCLNNLGWSHYSAGAHHRAKEFYESALALRAEILGADHPDVAWTLANLGLADEAAGDVAGACRRHEQALLQRENGLGPDHPLVAQSLGDLARCRALLGDTGRALELAIRAETLGREHALLTLRDLPERQALRHIAARGNSARRTRSLDLLLWLARTGQPGAAEQAFAAMIQARALVLDELSARQQVTRLTSDPLLRETVAELLAAREQLANLRYRGLSGERPAQYRATLEAARARVEQLESRLAQQGNAGKSSVARPRAGLAEIVRALPADGALVAHARHLGMDRDARGAYYTAFVLVPGSPVVVVPLAAAGTLEAAAARFQEQAARSIPDTGVSPAETQARLRASGVALREHIWDPIEKHVASARRVFVVPDGCLHAVSFDALPGNGAAYLAETAPVFHLLTAERDLAAHAAMAITAAGAKRSGNGLLVIGGPDFGTARDGEPAFSRLPQALLEAERVAALWAEHRPLEPRRSLLEAAASEAALKALAPGQRVIHLATHGFFLESQATAARLQRPGSRGFGRVVPSRPGEASGFAALALAGANQAAQAASAADDGILAAEEVSSLDLSGVELAVLSACDTGAGKIEAGEGILGLRRAFQLAGARSLIVSLWPVEDAATRDWMEAFYQQWLPGKVSAATAARNASLEVLRRRREKALDTRPFYWAGFVAVGE